MCVMATKTILMSDCAVIFKKRFDFWVIKKYNFLILTSQSVDWRYEIMFNYKKSRKVLVLTAAVSLLCSQSVFAETLELD